MKWYLSSPNCTLSENAFDSLPLQPWLVLNPRNRTPVTRAMCAIPLDASLPMSWFRDFRDFWAVRARYATRTLERQRLDSVLRLEVYQQLGEAALRGRVISKNRRESVVTQRFRETLAQSLTSARIVAQPGTKSVSRPSRRRESGHQTRT